ncbi:MAG: DNA-methyltransferase [Candidatus Thorarchaeota archaeon]
MDYPEDFINRIILGDCLDMMKYIPDNSIDLTVTSPPYDNLRTYKNNLDKFRFEPIAQELFRITKIGGVVVWIVGDAIIKGSKTGTSFKQALYFKEIGFNLHDTMIWNKGGFSAVGALKKRYCPVFDYMFILSKGNIKIFNPIKDRKTKHGGKTVSGTIRNADGSIKPVNKKMIINELSQRFNIWEQSPQKQKGKCHPAPFPEQLAYDHIISWSNPKDIILDPMCGSGTTCAMALKANRKYIGIEVVKEYYRIALKRIMQWRTDNICLL